MSWKPCFSLRLPPRKVMKSQDLDPAARRRRAKSAACFYKYRKGLQLEDPACSFPDNLMVIT